MSIYSEYLDRITNGDLETRHGGSLTTSFEKVAKSVRDFENKLTAFEGVVNPLYDHYNGSYISGDWRQLNSLFTRNEINPFGYGMGCKVKTIDGRGAEQRIDVASYLHYAYGYINNDPGYHDLAGDKYMWMIELTNNESRDVDVYTTLYHPNGEISDESYCRINHGVQDFRVYGIEIHSYQSVPRVLFHFYIGTGSNAPLCIDIRPSDEVTFSRWESTPV